MMSRQTLMFRLLGPVLCLAIVACSEDSRSPIEPGPDPSPDPGEEPPPSNNIAPEIAPIPDQTVLRNTATPRTLALDLEIVDPDDDTVQVTIQSEDESVVAGQSLACSPGTCAVTLAPSPERTAAVTVQVTAADASGGEATAEFRLDVSPSLVTNAEDSGPGSLRAAVADAERGDVVAFDTAGAFTGPQTIALQEQIVLDKVLTIEGPGADQLALSGGGAVRIFRANEGADVTVRGVTMTEGRAPVESLQIGGMVVDLRMGGGALVDAGAKLTLSASAIRANVAIDEDLLALGGGIANFYGSLVVNEGTEVTDNISQLGAGIGGLSTEADEAIAGVVNGVNARLSSTEAAQAVTRVVNAVNARTSFTEAAQAITHVVDAVIAHNEALVGGGAIYTYGGSVVVHASQIRENTAPLGAGIYNGGALTVEAGSIIADNTATGFDPGPQQSGSGGGIRNEDGATATITGSTIEANTAGRHGAGIENLGTLEVEAGTVIRDNQTEMTGGGVHNAENANATIRSSTIDGNTAELGGGISNKGEMLVQDSRIAENLATELGGGIDNHQLAVGSSPPVMVVDSSVITGNRAGSAGGGIHNSNADLALLNGTILSGNHAATGGGLRNEAPENAVTIQATLIGTDPGTDDGNTALIGGGITNAAGMMELGAGTRIQGNVAENKGGGVLNFASGTLILRAEARVTANTVTEVTGEPVGGGIYNFGTLENAGDVSGNDPDDIVP